MTLESSHLKHMSRHVLYICSYCAFLFALHTQLSMMQHVMSIIRLLIDCDSSVFTASITWVRFTGSGGTQIPTYTLSGLQCNTHAAGYYTGSMPSAGSIVSGNVCFAYSGSACFSAAVTIQIANCGSFYVYGLAPVPGCNYRYCTI